MKKWLLVLCVLSIVGCGDVPSVSNAPLMVKKDAQGCYYHTAFFTTLPESEKLVQQQMKVDSVNGHIVETTLSPFADGKFYYVTVVRFDQ